MSRAKWFGAAAILVAAAAPLRSQTRIGILVGGVSSTVSTATADQVPNKSSRTGFMAGVNARWKLGSRLSFGPAVVYIQKGANAEDNTGVIKEEIKISYVEVPLLLRLDLSDGGMRPFLLGGGAVSFLASCKLHFAGLGQDIKEDCKANNNEPTSTDMSAIVGAGVAFGRLALSVRYDLGLKNIKKASVGNDEVKNRALMGVVSFSM